MGINTKMACLNFHTHLTKDFALTTLRKNDGSPYLPSKYLATLIYQFWWSILAPGCQLIKLTCCFSCKKLYPLVCMLHMNTELSQDVEVGTAFVHQKVTHCLHIISHNKIMNRSFNATHLLAKSPTAAGSNCKEELRVCTVV